MKKSNEFIEKLIEKMTVEELCGQLMNFSVAHSKSPEDFEKIIQKMRPGAIFVSGTNAKTIAEYIKVCERYTDIPVMVAADVEYGAGCVLKGEELLPSPMAWGAADDEELIEKAGRITGEICRKNGLNWAFSPVVDINYNRDNCLVNTRAVSDSPQQVIKIAGAYARGMQANNMIAACCKHFPGDGVDDRNQHFCPTINSLSKEEWMKTYGCVYRKMFEFGAASVMVGHIALPCVEDSVDPVLGPLPGTFSYNIMTKLLREELGFEGCIVSDAMSMIGASVHYPPDRVAVEFIKAGGDMILFAIERDYDALVNAVTNGEISVERIKDSVRYVLEMKMRFGLFETEKEEIIPSGDIRLVSDEIAEKSITVIRNSENLLPLNLEKGAKILMVNLQRDQKPAANMKELTVIKEGLEQCGYQVDSFKATEIPYSKVNEIKDDYACILVNCIISSTDYLGGTLRINWDNIWPFWRGALVWHPCVIFTSFGDPYKLYEVPFVRTYVNAYSCAYSTQRAFVKVLLGEKEAVGKNPVELKGYFNREV